MRGRKDGGSSSSVTEAPEQHERSAGAREPARIAMETEEGAAVAAAAAAVVVVEVETQCSRVGAGVACRTVCQMVGERTHAHNTAGERCNSCACEQVRVRERE